MGELYHYGRRGMKWGQRLYQNKDGSLTALGRIRYRQHQKSVAKKRNTALKKARKARATKKQEELTVEEQRAKLLKSTDADFLYKNRKLLTAAEINERLNRIDAERRLSEVADKNKKAVIDRVDKVIKWTKKVDEFYQLKNLPMIKAIGKAIGLGGDEGGDEGGKSPNLDKIWKNLDNTSDEALNKAIKRANSEKAFKKLLDEQHERQSQEAQKKVDEYNQRLRDDIQREVENYVRREQTRNSTYRQVGENIVDRVFKSERVSNVVNDDSVSKGRSHISGLLDDPVKRLALPAPSDDKKK